jgi:hypothetical protein
MSSTRGSKTLAAAAIILVVATNAAAQSDAAMAETLFKEGKELMSKGDYVNGCPKLAESNRLDPGTGTLTALALCHEGQGKTATAWAEFIEVQSAAQQAQRADRVELAQQHIAQLEPLLPHLTIRVDAKVAQLRVLRDDVAVGNAAWSSAIAVDPGEHVVRAEAPGYKPFVARVTLAARDGKTVVVDSLERAEKTPSIGPVVTPAEVRDGKGQRIAGLVVGALGLATLGVGTYFGVQAMSEASTANSRCTPQVCTDPSVIALNDDAKHNALAADIVLGVGLAVTVVGLVVFLVAPHAPRQAAALSHLHLTLEF